MSKRLGTYKHRTRVAAPRISTAMKGGIRVEVHVGRTYEAGVRSSQYKAGKAYTAWACTVSRRGRYAPGDGDGPRPTARSCGSGEGSGPTVAVGRALQALGKHMISR